MAYSFEIGPIRPPNESNSLLIRVTRNCEWNKCRFCSSYKDKKFEIRGLEEIKHDIAIAKILRDRIMEITIKAGKSSGIQKVIGMILKDPPNESFRNVAMWLLGGGENIFLQDSNALVLKTEDLGQVMVALKSSFPRVKRITSYTRSQTVIRKKLVELIQLRQAGLSRLHIGLESGYDPVLQYMEKGETVDMHIKAGRKVVESGISLSEYIILGLGGKGFSNEHAKHTALALNEIDPEFIRLRTLIINNQIPLYLDVEQGRFVRATDEEIIREERLLIEKLNVHSNLVSDHVSNLLPELEGKLPQDKPKLFDIIDRFESLSTKERENFMIGRRIGLYKYLHDLEDSQKHDLVEQIKFKLSKNVNKLDPEIVFKLMEDFM